MNIEINETGGFKPIKVTLTIQSDKERDLLAGFLALDAFNGIGEPMPDEIFALNEDPEACIERLKGVVDSDIVFEEDDAN